MPKGPKGEKRPADVVSNAVHVMRIAVFSSALVFDGLRRRFGAVLLNYLLIGDSQL
jgi:hypothetical protein